MAPRRRTSEARVLVPGNEGAPQLTLFSRSDLASVDEAALEAEYTRARSLVARLPERLRFGTSSWSFPGWHRLVYARRQTEAQLARDGLREYARHPLLRTVGIDRGFYAPIPGEDLARYAEQLPPEYPCCAKVPERITSPLDRARNERNPDYLSVERFVEWVLEPFARSFASHLGPFVFEFSPLPPAFRPEPRDFAARLDRFFSELPTEVRYSVELRDRALLTPEYARVLRKHGVAHVYNYWSHMPSPAKQALRVPIDTAPFTVVRLLLPPGANYEERKRSLAPFDQVRDERPDMREDVTDLLRRVLGLDLDAFVLINNKAEGSSPLTAFALAELLANDS